jgi:uncharacterized repeat protein (TIGR01451 family)
MNNYYKIKIVSTVIAMLLSATVFAAPKVSINLVAEKDIVEVDKKGKEKTRRVVATETVPGDVLFYTINFENTGDESAKKVQIDNPIAEGSAYKAKSTWGDDSEILFSIDGKSFKKASSLTYEIKDNNGKTEQKTAAPEQYTAIRWIIDEIPAGSKGKVGFSVVVK